MYLKEVQLENFKSFGKSIRIPFLEGFSAITGPNGSGKSNISDAVLFVLGPKSSKAMRAGKLTDLIFNGGKDKKRANYCKVTLIFDNSDRLIPVDNDEVQLTRLVKLSATDPEGYNSYFYVNGKKSSLNEFDNLLAHARISADGYNIVQQGDITRIVEMGILERRRVLDHIAGITKFDDDISKAEEKRIGVDENLSRINIILEEIERQIQQLESDRKVALKYKEVKDALDLAKGQIAYKKKENAENEINSINQQIANFEKETEALQNKRKELEAKHAEINLQLDKVEKEIVDKGGDEAKHLKEKIDNLRLEIARAQEGINNSKEQLKILKNQRTGASNDMENVKKDLNQLENKKKELAQTLTQKEQTLKQKEEEFKTSQELATKSDLELASIQKELININRSLEAKNDEFSRLKLEEDRNRDKLVRLKSEIAELEELQKTHQFELKDADWNLKNLRTDTKTSEDSAKNLQEAFFTAKARETKLVKESEELELAIRQLTRKYEQLKAETEAMESLQKGYTNAVRAVLEGRDKGILRGVHGTIAELAQVDKQYEVAMNIAAGNRMQSIVVEDDESGAKAINYLRQKGIGRATFLPLNKMLDGRPRGKSLIVVKDTNSLGFAIDLIKFDEKYRTAFWYVFGDTVIVRNLDTARKLMGGVRLATLEGELTEASGAMIGGALEKDMLKFGIPSQSEIDKVGAELRKAIEHSEKLNTELKQVREELTKLETELKTVSNKSSVSSLKIEEFEARKKGAVLKFDSLNKELSKKIKELEEFQIVIQKVQNDLTECEKAISELKKQKEIKGKKIMALMPEQLAQKLKSLQAETTDLTKEFTTLKSNSETLEAQINIRKEKMNEISVKINEIDAQIKSHNDKIEKLTKDIAEFDTHLKAHLKLEASADKEMKDLRVQRDHVYNSKADIEKEIENINIKIDSKSDFVLGLQAKLKVSEEKLAELNIELLSYKLNLTEKLPSFDSLKKKIQECETELQSLGSVNMKAIEDYEAQQKRHEELSQEVKRLETEKNDLIRLVQELTEKKKFGLFKVFNAINENFKKVYSELSGGGEAELFLEKPETPFEGGLIIKARPKNTKVLRIEALSGGEKSLTALAFIFAIQIYDPSPFYLLDEVDMFLDAVNAENVARTVKRNSKNAQFIMVSLRKVTLKEADHIIGVTKQSNGISEVVMKVNLNEIEEPEVDKTLKVRAEPSLNDELLKGEWSTEKAVTG